MNRTIKLEISTLLKTITNSCFQALEGLKFQALEGLKFQDKQTQNQMIQTHNISMIQNLLGSSPFDECLHFEFFSTLLKSFMLEIKFGRFVVGIFNHFPRILKFFFQLSFRPTLKVNICVWLKSKVTILLKSELSVFLIDFVVKSETYRKVFTRASFH